MFDTDALTLPRQICSKKVSPDLLLTRAMRATTARSTMMQPEDVARAIMLCVTLPPRTVIEEIVMVPTVQRDVSEDIRVAAAMGARGT